MFKTFSGCRNIHFYSFKPSPDAGIYTCIGFKPSPDAEIYTCIGFKPSPDAGIYTCIGFKPFPDAEIYTCIGFKPSPDAGIYTLSLLRKREYTVRTLNLPKRKHTAVVIIPFRFKIAKVLLITLEMIDFLTIFLPVL